MKKSFFLTQSILILALAGCTGQPPASNSSEQTEQQTWEEIRQTAAGETVRMYMWGGDEGINQYMDEWVKPRLKEEYDVTLERIPLNTNEIIQKLETEKRAGQQDGTIDLIWMNGENFKRAKESSLLHGPFTEQIPNYQSYYDTESLDFTYDFGTETEGFEAPWGKVQFVFHYDSSKISNPPSTLEELQKWTRENPGKFTYPAAGDFTGDAFIRHVLYGKASSLEQLLDEPFSMNLIEEESEDVWRYLNEMEPDLWRSGETYPSSLTELDRLYSQGEIWMTMGYNEARAEVLVEDGIFPETTESFILEEPGSIGNTHFLSIPFNSPNKEAAMAAIDFMLAPDAQSAKLSPEYWGENTPIDLTALSSEQKEPFEKIDRGKTVLDQQTLNDAFLPEIDAAYVPWLQEKWIDEVASQ
ncbi:ABC transporter substrate-binding protein [Jeotgalibacillus campisalis]|uniref:ABC transporter substrate-binding protein n=1 Tax=Jeotgalibacillus campisalis TaxID=220754 RepID=A0A0C2S415_9BACL|nr:ABC transporter substrate-binding protein [Jeotgalibacillus campisalis]KIL48744.1 ABC transporter substrate-binding protein [Jeotgalibacillus campisalis]